MPPADVPDRLAMVDRKTRKTPDSWIARHNRRGCFLIALVLALLIAALAYIGFHGDPIDELESDIPALG